MRSLHHFFVMTALGALFLLSSCVPGTPDTVHTEPQTVREQKIESLLKDYGRKIEALDAKVAAASGTAQKDIQRSLDDLRRQHREASRTLEELRNATTRSWKDVNARLQAQIDELKRSYDRTREQMN